MLHFIFYAWGILVLIYELHFLASIKTKPNQRLKEKELYIENEDKEAKDWSSEFYTLIFKKVVRFFFGIWFYIGLLTFQWPVFAIFILLTFISDKIAGKLYSNKSNIRWIIVNTIWAIISIIVVFFIIINGTQLHINILNFFR